MCWINSYKILILNKVFVNERWNCTIKLINHKIEDQNFFYKKKHYDPYIL